MESMMIKIGLLSEYRSYLCSFAACITVIWVSSTTFSKVRHWSLFHRSFKIALIAMMEILGLDPYQSQTQYLQANLRGIAERRQSGDTVTAPLPHSIRLVSTSNCFKKTSGDEAETLLSLCRLYQITYLQRGHK
jgi:hypothetical protein